MVMRTIKILFGFLFVGLFCESSLGQSSAAFQSLIYPHSLSSSGLGEQGVASRNASDAMQYNPANLVYADDITVSFFRNPWNLIGWSVPLTATSVLMNFGDIGSVGLEYTYWNYGDVEYTTISNPDGIGESYHAYERSIAGGFAIPLGNNLAVGAQIRYIWQPIFHRHDVDHFLFNAGVSYKPVIFSDRITLGASFINFGTTIEYERSEDTIIEQLISYYSQNVPPAQINLGIEGLVIAKDFFDITLAVSATKPLDKRGGPPDYSAQSSFKSLFNDWTDFPEDVTGRIGLSFIWHPLYLGMGISFIQEMYLGYFSTGPKDLYNSFYTHGIKVGLDVYGVKVTAGYAGRWHNNNIGSYLTWYLPWETFQFNLSVDRNILGATGSRTRLENPLVRSSLYQDILTVFRLAE